MAKGFRAPSLKELYLEFVDINHNIVGKFSLILGIIFIALPMCCIILLENNRDKE